MALSWVNTLTDGPNTQSIRADQPLGKGKAHVSPMQPMQRTGKSSRSTDHAVTHNMAELKQMLSRISQQLGDVTGQLTSLEI